jgi:hypothetical protein
MSGGEGLWDGGESGERLMDSGERLERAYGRLLRWYPAGHQARHADEMLGVLMAGAGSGRRRPGLADSADLIGGALRIRLRAATTGSAGLWREALGRAGILLPLAWVVLMVTYYGPGARLTWQHYLLTVAATVAAGVAGWRLESSRPPYSVPGPAGWPAAEVAGLAVVAAITIILLVSSAVSRRLLIVSAVPLYFYVAVIVTPASGLSDPLLDLPLVALAGVAALLAVRWARTRRRAAAGGA